MASDSMTKDKKSEVIISLYQNRFKQLRLGQESYKKGNLSKSVEHYSNYLSILAQFFDISKSNLKPELFDQKKDIGELLLISNVYWNLAKIYDKNKKFQHHSIDCLNQFLRFTRGYKHQYANARILKNYINRGRPKNTKEFNRIYEKMKINSSPCFVSTYCFGYNAPVTKQLRLFKKDISGSSIGDTSIKYYYKYAPILVHFFECHSKIKKIALPPIKNILFLIAWLHRNLRFNKNDHL